MFGELNQRFRSSNQRFTSGPSFPNTACVNDVHLKTDPNTQLLCYWDGTRWLTVNQYIASGIPVNNIPPITQTTATILRWPIQSNYDVFLNSIKCAVFVTSNGPSNFYTFAINKTAANGTDTQIASFDTSADAAATWTNHDTGINVTVSASAHKVLGLKMTPTLNPGTMNYTALLLYRLVVT